MRSVQIQEMMRIDEEIAEILNLGVTLLRTDGQNPNEFQEVKEEGFADLEEIVGVIYRSGRFRRLRFITGRSSSSRRRRRFWVKLFDTLFLE